MIDNQLQTSEETVITETSPIQSVPAESKPSSSHTFLKAVLIIAVLLLIILGSGFFYIQKKLAMTQTQTESARQSQTFATPTPAVIDTAPAIPLNQKAHVLVHHSDSTFNVYLIPKSRVGAYSQTLPQGDSVINISDQ